MKFDSTLESCSCDVALPDQGISGARFDCPELPPALEVATPGGTLEAWRLISDLDFRDIRVGRLPGTLTPDNSRLFAYHG